jgi:deoxycytidylate deaminase
MAVTPLKKAPAAAVGPEPRGGLTPSLQERRSPELVIALVGAIGSGVSRTAEMLKEKLEKEYEYSARILKASQKIIESAHLVNEPYDDSLQGSARIDRLQDIGNKLRLQLSNNYVVEKCIEEIATKRLDHGYDQSHERFIAKPLREAHIIDSLKHPEEVQLLREVYGDVFWLVAVFAPEIVRERRLKHLGVEAQDISYIFSRDENDHLGHGQKVRDTAHLADFFVRNDGQNDSHLSSTLDRYLEIIFNITVRTPTAHEAAMYNAMSASSKAACLSRQVGAAIYSRDGELLGVGWNDVPKANGGLYTVEDGDKDHRCYRWGEKICHNDDRKEKLYQKVFAALNEEGLLSQKADPMNIRASLRKTDIRNLIEYSRSVHAEMEAIISCARRGMGSLVGGRLYSTTFPCHNCARHIVASGIKEVYYIEPYPKSLALDLHNDAVSTDEGDKSGKVVFLQYDGVAPKNVLKLFRSEQDRKAGGKAVVHDKKKATPVYCPAMDGFTTYEQMIVKDLKEKEEQLGSKGADGGGAA